MAPEEGYYIQSFWEIYIFNTTKYIYYTLIQLKTLIQLNKWSYMIKPRACSSKTGSL